MIELARREAIDIEVRELAQKTLESFSTNVLNKGTINLVVVKHDFEWLAGTAGYWSPNKQQIRMNMRVLTTEKDYRDTLVHEWAHAVTHYAYGSRHGHDGVWKKVARAMGDDGERCHTIKLAERLPGRYTSYVCPCGQPFNLSYRVVAKIKAGQRRWCRKCKTTISLDKRPAAIAAETVPQTAVGYPTTCNCCGTKVYFSGRRIGFLRKGRIYTHTNCGGAFKEG